MASKFHHKRTKSLALQLLRSVSESLQVQPCDVAHVEGQYITPHGNLVYPVRFRGRRVFVTVPENDSD